MNGSFNGQILVDKLAKLNNSQQSIETLSHWCIFHRNKAKQVVETWEQQFHCSPSEQRVSFLYLANDILQNSRRKGLEFINEFWKVLPDALTDVFANGGDFGRKTVLRLVDIWEERKVFGSRGQILKEDILGRKFDNRNKNGNAINYKLKQSSGELLEKIISSYAHVCDEDALFGKCQAAISIVDKVEKEVGSDIKLGSINGSEVIGELQMQHSILGECIEQLKAAELSRATLISFLREALHEQETKIEQIRHQLEAAESRCKQASNISAQLNSELPTEQRPREPLSAFSDTAPGFVPEATASSGDATQITPARHTQEEPLSENNSSHTEEEHRKTAAAAVAAKLTASASSAQMLSYVLSSLASEGVIGQANKEGSPPENKRPKIENNVPSQVLLSQPLLQPSSQPLLQPPMPFFPHPESLHQLPPPEPLSPMAHPSSSMEPVLLPPPSLPLTQPPLLPITTQFMQTAAGPMTGVPYTYGSAPPPLPNYPMFGMHPNPSAPIPYHSFQASEGANLFVQPPLSTAPPPLTRQ